MTSIYFRARYKNVLVAMLTFCLISLAEIINAIKRHFYQIFSMLMSSLHHSPSDQVQNGCIFVKKYCVFAHFFAQNNAIPAIVLLI